MRADRLVAVLLMLQSRGQVTVGDVAAELEISERTARRDFEALGASGIPVYSVQGRNGGWRLLGGGKTDLTGLNASEVRALFLLSASSHLSDDIKSAMRKLTMAVPESLRATADAVEQSVVIDPTNWDDLAASRATEPARFLDAVQRAVIEAAQITIGYRDRQRNVSKRTVDPFGLAAKGRHWYLIAGTENGQRTFRVDRITSLTRTGADVVKPDDFRIEEVWRDVADRIDEQRTPIRAAGECNGALLHIIRSRFGSRLRIGPPLDDGERVQVEIRGHSVQMLAAELAGFVRILTVTGPSEVQAELADLGRSLVKQYA